MKDGILSIPSESVLDVGKEANLPVYNVRIAPPPQKFGRLIRWGCTTGGVTARKVYNKARAIEKASSKALCRSILKEAGIPIPEFDSHHFPCIGRKKKHTKGHGFYICKNPEDVKRAKSLGATYFSAFYPKTKEYRVHVGRNRTILLSEKSGSASKIRWNYQDGLLPFKHLSRRDWLEDPELKEIVHLAKRTIRVLDLDFGAVDIMAYPNDPKLPKAVVCEVNTAPALSESAVRRYARYFNRLLDGYYDNDKTTTS